MTFLLKNGIFHQTISHDSKTRESPPAGIDEAGATEVLRFLPTEEAVMEKVVNLYDHRKKD
jgi:hypothetical protein